MASAGNHGTVLTNPNHTENSKIHSSGAGTDSIELLLTNYPDSIHPNTVNWQDSTDFVCFYIVYDKADSYEITLAGPTFSSSNPVCPNWWWEYGPYPLGTHTGGMPGGGSLFTVPDCTDGVVRIAHEVWGPPLVDPLAIGRHPNHNVIMVYIQDAVHNNRFWHLHEGVWQVRMDLLSGPGLRWDAYIIDRGPRDFIDAYPKAFTDASFDNSNLLIEPSTAHDAICVGSYDTKGSWSCVLAGTCSDLGVSIGATSCFSSPGPTMDGRLKPELLAPGAWITCSHNQSWTPPSDTSLHPDQVHMSSRGTSFSAPHVTGTAALMLQKNSKLSYTDVRDLLVNNSSGGKLDALAAVQATPHGCVGKVGNIDCDPRQELNLADVMCMAEHMFVSPTSAFCSLEEADIDGSGQPNPTSMDVDGADLTLAIEYILINPGSGPPDCP